MREGGREARMEVQQEKDNWVKYRLYDETEGSTGFRYPREPI